MDSAPAFAALTRRIYPDLADLESRRDLAHDPPLLSRQLSERLSSANGWLPLRDFLLQCVADRIPTLVYGDYDVDGSTSAALMFRWLRSHGVPANIFLPSRFKHGYGLDLGTIQLAPAQGYKRLLALDCGTANLEEVSAARAGGLEVAIVDHHTCKEALPDALLLNPHTDACLPPLCTAGLVYSILATLALHDGHDLVGDELELAGLATIADIVPLEPLNWALGHHALERLPGTQNVGLQELLKVSRLHGLTRITGRQAGFDLIPRLNAAGRMATARIVSQLFIAEAQEARQIAGQVERLNIERKEITRRITEQAHAQALRYGELGALVLGDSGWHPGVLGIVAARVAEQHGKPAIILADAPGGSQLWSGSVRTFGGVDVIAALAECSSHLHTFGGHEAAAGVKLTHDALEDFRAAWHNAVIAQAQVRIEADTDSVVESELPEANLGELSAQFEDDIWQLRPYGPSHTVARIILKDVRIARADYMGSERTHIALQVTDSVRQARVVGFSQSHLLPHIKVGEQVRLVVECEPDNWNNSVGLMLRLVEVA